MRRRGSYLQASDTGRWGAGLRDNDNLVAKGYYATIELSFLNGFHTSASFFQDSLIAVTNRRLNPIPESEAEDLFGSMSSFYK